MAKDIRVVMTLDTGGFRRGVKDAEGSLDSLQKKGNDVAGVLRGAFATIIGIGTIDQFVKMEAALTGLQNKLNVVAGSQQAANEAFATISGIAGRTRNDLAAVGDLYTKIALAGEQLGLSTAQVAQTTETFSKALKLTGASGAQAQAAILQFGQALASGKMQGDEFRSLMENAPGYMGKLSKALGVSQGELRKLATEGALTADVIIAATQEMAATVEDDFAKTTPTISDAFTILKNNVMLTFDEINKGTGVFAVIREAVMLLANNIGVAFKFIGAMIAFALGAKAVAMVFNFIKALQALRIATKAQTIAQAALLAMGGPAGLAALAAGAAAAAAAYYALDKAIPDSIKLPEMPQGSDLGEGPSAVALLEQAKARAQSDKDAKKAAREAEREAERQRKLLERQRAEAEKLLQTARDQVTLGKEKFANDMAAIGLGETAKKTQDDQFKIEQDRLAAVREINSLTAIGESQRNAYLSQTNAQYEQLKQNAADYNQQLANANALFQQQGQLMMIGANSKVAMDQVKQQMQLDMEFNAARRQIMQDRFAIDNEYFLAQQELRSKFKNQDDADLQRELRLLEERRLARIKAFNDEATARQAYADKQKTFGYGWEQAMGNFAESLNNQAAYAQRIFDTMTQGFTNSLMKFVETGKLSFGDLFRSLLAEIIKMQANKLFLSIFGKGGPLGSIFGSLFDGARAMGGPVSAGKRYLVGEKGPEMFIPRTNGTIAANNQLTAMGDNGGMNAVTYNIQAVDALSFRQMLARDPEFLYNLTEQQRRGIPSRRRA